LVQSYGSNLIFFITVRLNFTENHAMPDISHSYGTSVNMRVAFNSTNMLLLAQIISGTVPLGTRCW
jgi:hypothetical protein